MTCTSVPCPTIFRRRSFWFLAVLWAACFLIPSHSIHAQNSFVNFEGKLTSPIRVSPDGSKLFAVNTPDNRLSIFDISAPGLPVLIAEIPVGLEPVSVSPRTDDEVWVVNEVSDSVSVVSVSRRVVTDTIYVKDEPADVVFARGRAFVTASRRNQINVFDVMTHAQLAVIPLQGENPRSMAVRGDGSKLYAAFALSGNRTTLIPPDQAPPPPPPTNPALPPGPQVGLIVDATDPTWAPSVLKYTMPDNDVVEVDVDTLTVSRYFSRVGTVNFALALRPHVDQLYVANTDARNLVRFEPALRGHIVSNRVSRLNLANGTVTHFDLETGVNFNVMPNLAAKTNALAQPTAIVFEPDGGAMFITAFGSDRVARLDASGNVTDRIEIGSARGSDADSRRMRGPRGLALGPAASERLYVLNRIANTISIVDTQQRAVVGEIPTGSYDPTPPNVREGRGFLYDARLSGSGNASCAACHIDAEMDLIAWDLGDPNGTMSSNATFIIPGFPATVRPVHPMKGPMTTQTLRGLNGQDPLHWRGDRTNFLHFNGAFESLLGGDLLSPSDMVLYRAYVNTIRFQPNPNQNMDRTYPTNFKGANAEAGRNTFFNEFYQPGLRLACTTCHTGPPGSGSDFLIFDRLALEESQDFKVPHLRNVYQKLNVTRTPGAASVGGFGIIHDGSDPDLFTFLSRNPFGTFSTDTTRKRNLEAFVQCFDTGLAPAVGYSRTVTLSNATQAAVISDWNLLESQAAAGNINLIVKGTFQGRRVGMLYNPTTARYRPDRQAGALFSRAQLQAQLLAGDAVTLLGVVPGTGTRLGIDRDLDAILDGDVAAPNLAVWLQGEDIVIQWSATAASFTLASSASLVAPAWEPDTTPREMVGGKIQVVVPASGEAQFFRLREL